VATCSFIIDITAIHKWDDIVDRPGV